MTFGIYCIEHIESGRKYIGKSKNIEDRFKKHRTQLLQDQPKNGVNSYLWNLVQKYGIDSLKFWIVEEVSPQDDDVLADREVFWMDELKTLDRNFGFNLRRDSSSGTTLTPEMIDNIRKAKLGEKNPNYGKPMHPNSRRALLERKGEKHPLYGKTGAQHPVFGLKRSDDVKRKLSESKLGERNPNFGKFGENSKSYGTRRTDEQKKRMSDARKSIPMSEDRRLKQCAISHKFSYLQYDLSGNLVGVYWHPDSLVESGFLPPNVSKVCSCNRTHKGYYWRKIPKIDKSQEYQYLVENSDNKLALDRVNAKNKYLYEQYALDGTVIRDFSAKELEQHGFNLSTVLKCCKNTNSVHKGFKWRKIPKIDLDTPPQPKV